MALFGKQLLGLYAPGNAAVIEKGMIRLYIVGLTHFICGIMEVGCGCVRGIGKSILSMIVSLLGACVFRVIWVFTVFRLVPDDIKHQTLYFSYPLSWILTAAVFFWVFAIVLRKTTRKWESEKELLRT
jgi:Na+-driven multidrug efflux pump